MKLHRMGFTVVCAWLAASILAGCVSVPPEPQIPKRTELLPLSEEYADEDEESRALAAARPSPGPLPAPAPAPAPPPPAAAAPAAELLGGAGPLAGDRFISGCAIPWE